jgi:hypothetical protein
MKILGLRGLTEHKQLQAQQFTIHPVKFLFNEFISKTVKGGLKDKTFTPKTITQFQKTFSVLLIYLLDTCFAFLKMARFLNDHFLSVKTIQ